MRISDWSLDVCSSDLRLGLGSFCRVATDMPMQRGNFRQPRTFSPPNRFGRQKMNIDTAFNRSYFEARLDRNRRLAARSRNPEIRAIHMEYVRLYSQLLEQSGRAQAPA